MSQTCSFCGQAHEQLVAAPSLTYLCEACFRASQSSKASRAAARCSYCGSEARCFTASAPASAICDDCLALASEMFAYERQR